MRKKDFFNRHFKKRLMGFSRNSIGFTFVEVLVVVAIITILAAAVIIVINPAKRFEEARDRQREMHLQTILNAIEMRMTVERGWFPPCEEFPSDIDEQAQPIFKTIGTKDDPLFYDLYKCLLPVYLSTELFDPEGGNKEDTKYLIWQNPYNKKISLIYVKKDKKIVAGPENYAAFSVPSLSTNEITSISYNSAISGGKMIDYGDAPISERGLVWATSSVSEYPTILDNKILDQSPGDIFSLAIAGLNPNTAYSVRAYAVNDFGEGYGNRRWFNTCTLQPMVNTLEAINVSYNRATLRGEVVCVGTENPSRYFEWGTTTGQYTQNTPVGVSGAGVFSANLINIKVQQTYYFRACAQNTSGWKCGTEKSFYTDYTVPVLTTAEVENITWNSAESGGSISDDGGMPVTARGVCWNIIGSPTIDDQCTADGTGTGSFVSHMADLVPGLTYYVRAYAVNDIGAGYGEIKVFKTIGFCFGAESGGDPGGAALSCSVREGGCFDGETSLLKMSRSANAHAETADQAFYSQHICCSGNELSNSCEGQHDTFLKLAKITNSHVEKKDQQNYPISACLSTTFGSETPYPSTIACGYVTSPNNCSDLGELYACLGSLAKETNSHVGDCDAFPIKICCANICP